MTARPVRIPPVWAAFAAIFVLSLAFRLHDLGLRPLWLDELFSDWFAARDWRYLWAVTPTYEIHPPLYYSLLKIWRSFGDDEFTLRLLSVLFAQATLCLVFIAGRLAGGAGTGLLAAYFFACDKLQLFYAQDARPYAGFVFAMALAMVSALWLLRHPDEVAAEPRHLPRRAVAAYVGLATGLALLQWFQSLGLLFILPIGVFLVGWWFMTGRGDRGLLRNLSATALLALLLYAPFLHDFIFQLRFFNHGFWLSAPHVTWLASQSMRLFGQSLDGMRPPLRAAIYALTIAPAAVYGGWRLWRSSAQDGRRPMLVLLLVTSAGAWLFSILITYGWQPVFMERTLLPLQVPWFILLAMIPFAAKRRMRLALILVLIGVFTYGAGEYWFLKDAPPNGIQRPWKELVQIIAEKGPDVPVIAVPNHVEMALGYYERRLNVKFTVYALPAPFPAVDDRYAYPLGGRAVPQITQPSVDAVMRTLAGAPRIWLVTHGATLDPEDEAGLGPERLIDKALAVHYRGAAIYCDRSATLVLYTAK